VRNRTEPTNRTKAEKGDSPQSGTVPIFGGQPPACGLKKCPFRKMDRDRIAWNGKVKGDTRPRTYRQVNGRQVWAEMPPNVFHVEDRVNPRIIFAGRGLGDRYMVLFRRLDRPGGAHRFRIIQKSETRDQKPELRGRIRRELVPSRATLSEALQDLWNWVKQQQTPSMVVVEGEVE